MWKVKKEDLKALFCKWKYLFDNKNNRECMNKKTDQQIRFADPLK